MICVDMFDETTRWLTILRNQYQLLSYLCGPISDNSECDTNLMTELADNRTLDSRHN